MALASGVLLSACSVVGIRGTPEPPYRTVAQVGDIVIRDYGPRLAAEVEVPGDEIAARSTGFQLLAGYIFGGNHAHASIAMTAPVTQSAAKSTSAKIAMTAPVDQARTPGGWRVRFFMPSEYTAATLPVPNDKRVHIVTVPGRTVAVLRYSGIASKSAVRDAARRLLHGLQGSAWHAEGEPAAWFYDPPWTLPPLRRNEAVVPVTRGAP